ncbi:hypothetical protein [Luteolibacter luteus]|uniref:HEAT repeat domain-containing protein n=1 Tax=Luteolibacter luteus TaxID=2728835 RepID=A0A858RGT0_9BACT|nr:hypothetical protein [Luteolibacter luteus]QJE96366.1 hypothetical protein HHL09_11410 [Luteolibacter luteus]
MRTAILIPIAVVALATGALVRVRTTLTPEESRPTKSGRDPRTERIHTTERDAEEKIARIAKLALDAPREAEALALELEGRERDEALAVLSAELARADADHALKVASLIEEPQARGNSLGFVLAQLAGTDVESVFTWLAQTNEGELVKASVERMALPALAEVDPERVAHWIAAGKATPAATETAVVTTVQRWVQQDRSAAARWVASFEDERLLHNGMEALVSGWTKQARDEPSPWIKGLPEGKAKDQACAAYAAALAPMQPEGASLWAGQIKDPVLAAQTAQRIGAAR